MIEPVPIVVVVGFLGAGKTTFIRDLLPLLEARGLEPFVLINDYANARVDASSLQEEGRPVKPINGNCICCDSIVELTNVLLDIPLTKRRLVLIEANGTTDPTALLEHLLINPGIRERFSPLLQVAIVDLKRWGKRHWHNDLERLQVETASHILFTYQESVSAERFAEVRGDIDCFNPKANWVEPQRLASKLENLVLQSGAVSTSDAAASSATSGDTSDSHHDSSHEHENHHENETALDRHQLAHAFVGLEIRLPDPMSASHLQRWLKALPREVLRVKGVIRLPEDAERWFQFQRVDDFQGEATLHELSRKPIVPACAVLIGVNLDEAAIQDALAKSSAESTFV